MNIYFTKMHGLGNDFIVIDNFNGRIKLDKEEIATLCNRNKGIGADGLILVETSEKGVGSKNSPQVDCFMNYYNSDGTPAEMCGNGIRCIAKYLKNSYRKDSPKASSGEAEKNVFEIETRAGIKKVICESDGTFSVNMGKPIFSHTDFPDKKIKLEGLDLDFVSVGNPHAVALVKNIKDFDLMKIGHLIENDSNFPNKINFELVEKKGDKVFKTIVWERGCGATLACDTGACAVYAIMQKQNNTEGEVTIELPGGELFVKQNEDGEIIMRGEAKSVYGGEVTLSC